MYFIEMPYCDFNDLFIMNQSLRWKKVNDNKYVIANGDHLNVVQQRKNKKAMLCTEDDFYDSWFKYFHCQYDYDQSYYEMRKFFKNIKDKYPFLLFEKNKDIRILRSDLFESMLYYALDDKSNFRELIGLCTEKKKNSLGGLRITWHKISIDTFNINNLRITTLTQVEQKSIKHIFYKLKEDNSILSQIEASDGNNAYDLLYDLNPDVLWIKNIMLHSLGFLYAFPVEEQDKVMFKKLGLRPSDFEEYDNIKGLILEVLRRGAKWE